MEEEEHDFLITSEVEEIEEEDEVIDQGKDIVSEMNTFLPKFRKVSRFAAYVNLTSSLFFLLFVCSAIVLDFGLTLSVFNILFKSKAENDWDRIKVSVVDLGVILFTFLSLGLLIIPLFLSFLSIISVLYSTKTNIPGKYKFELGLGSLITTIMASLFFCISDIVLLIIFVVMKFLDTILKIRESFPHITEYIKILGSIDALLTVVVLAQVFTPHHFYGLTKILQVCCVFPHGAYCIASFLAG